MEAVKQIAVKFKDQLRDQVERKVHWKGHSENPSPLVHSVPATSLTRMHKGTISNDMTISHDQCMWDGQLVVPVLSNDPPMIDW